MVRHVAGHIHVVRHAAGHVLVVRHAVSAELSFIHSKSRSLTTELQNAGQKPLVVLICFRMDGKYSDQLYSVTN